MGANCNSILFIVVYLLIFFAYAPTPQSEATGISSKITTTVFSNQKFEKYFHNNSIIHNPLHKEQVTVDTYTYAFLNYSYVSELGMNSISYKEEKARYGEGKVLTVHGQLIHISNAADTQDDSACNSNLLGTNGMALPLSNVPWIALVRRGHCTFEDKVRNVHSKGAAGVIVYNDRSVLNLEKMQIKDITRNITAVITYEDIGLNMVNCLDNGHNITAHIIQGRSGTRPINSINRTSVLFVIIAFIILMAISLIWLIFYYIQKFRYMQTKDLQSRHLCSVAKKVIMKIPIKTAKNYHGTDNELDCCAVCIEVYNPSDVLRVLPCSHEFHKSCIDPWLIEHRTCPMCKLDVLKFYGYTVDGKVHLAAMETPITTPVPTPLQNLTPTEVSTSTTLSTFETIEAVAHVTAELQHANHTNPSITLTDDTVSILLFTDSSQARQDGIGALSPESHLTPQSDYNQILTHQQLLQYHQKMLQRFLFVTDYNKIGKLLNSRNYKTSTACQPLSGHQMQLHPTTNLTTSTASMPIRSIVYCQVKQMSSPTEPLRLHRPANLPICNGCNTATADSCCESDSAMSVTEELQVQALNSLIVKHTVYTGNQHVTDV